MSSQFPISSPCPFERNKGVGCGSFYCGCTYFSIVRHLNNIGMNPKIKLNNVHVNESDLMEVFGPKCGYKLTNQLFHPDTKQLLKKLH
jgi:hypothetical protein